MTSTPTAGRQVSARRRPGARDKRKQVLDAAVQLFLANGFDQTSMDAIAAQAGVSKTTVYAHYSDKLALFRAVVERSGRALAVQMDESRLRGEQDPQVRLAEIVLIVLEATTSPEFQAFLRVMVTESGRHPDLAFAGESAGLVDVIGLIASTLEDEAERHGYELADARMFATVLLRMVASGPQLDSLLFPEFRPEHTLLDSYARWITAIFLRGIQPRTGDAREVAPPAGSYGYPWLPETGGRR
ncbi:TetR/AcrR family transcriptional regulator [Trebonia kvetii]|uniref:TetR/AcrR family transcriptional regulator n=1 Tax=Trebonia kvetii TaxID=2480626 RepID=A0A6P2BMG7_9ACTN|nr:TetR/AcrR family transcriptional regulator [Trebonia kvetii]TVY99806.1 TetR/AcrR family transcriptional regulator [Trebonia kvetii]